MATINNFVGFETGGLEEVAVVVGSPTAQSSVVRTGTFALELLSTGSDHAVDVSPFEDVADAGDDQILGFAVRFTKIAPSVATLIVEAQEGVNDVISLRLATNGDLELLDSAGAVVGTATSPFTVDTWHYVELRWQHLDSGAADVFIDDVSKISVAAKDFNLAGTFDTYQFQNSFGAEMTTYIDDIYVLSGASGTGDFLGKLTEVVGPYNKTNGGAAELGDTLDVGTWALASEIPFNSGGGSRGDYTGTPKTGGMDCNTGTRSGPSGDARIDGDANIKAAKWIYELARGSGGDTTHEIRYGNSADGLTNRGVSPTPGFKTFVKVSVSVDEVPLSTETFQIGMAVAGPRSLLLGDACATILHVADSPVPPTVTADEIAAHHGVL